MFWVGDSQTVNVITFTIELYQIGLKVITVIVQRGLDLNVEEESFTPKGGSDQIGYFTDLRHTTILAFRRKIWPYSVRDNVQGPMATGLFSEPRGTHHWRLTPQVTDGN